LGLDERTALVYQAMVLHREWDLDEIADHLGVGPADIHAALDRLAQLSLIRPSWDRPGELTPVNPAMGLSALLAGHETDLEEQRVRIARSREAIARLSAEWDASRHHLALNAVERLEGLDEVRLRLEELAEGAQSEVLSFMTGGAQSPSSLAASRPLDERTLSRGLRLRSIYLDSVRNDRPTREYAAWLVSAGGETRTVPSLPVRMIICDRRVAVVPIDPDDTAMGALQLTARGIVTALVGMFESTWERAQPFGNSVPRREGEPTPQERQLLQLLRSGLTDDGVSRQLGLSVRTTRRMVANMMERLAARSRFEVGYEAAKRNWI
jgi:sugar-specific transcriptional regulator TrmB